MSRPDDLAKHFALAIQHHQAGHLAEAERLYRELLAAEPNHAGALNLLGVVAAQSGHGDAAVALIGRAIQLDGENAGYHVNLGLAEQRRGHPDVAAACYRRALDLAPGNADAHNNLGILLQNQGRYDAAAAHFERCLAAQPDHAEALINLTLARRNQGRLEQAIACGRRALALRPNAPEAHNNLALALDNIGRVEEALAHYGQALALKPDYAEALNNLGLSLYHAGRPEASLDAFDQALALRGAYGEAQLNQAMVRLSTGDFRRGWAHYEARWQTGQMAQERRHRDLPLWDGSAGAGRTILLWAEQGMGDTLQFCRYVPLLAARGWRVVLEVQAPLVRLLGRLAGAAAVVPLGAVAAADCQAPLMSLPLLFGTVLETIPAPIPYLAPAPEAVERWAERLAAAGLGAQGLRVGLVWAGNPRRHAPLLALTDARRSIALDALAPLLAVPGARFVSLQKDLRPGEVPTAYGLIDLMDEVEDFADTAALIAQLDLIIAVDTSTLHLAGAMGKPVWLLNRFDTCWRWLRQRDDSPGYPTLRQFRQPALGDWNPVLAASAAALRRLAAPDQSGRDGAI